MEPRPAGDNGIYKTTLLYQPQVHQHSPPFEEILVSPKTPLKSRHRHGHCSVSSSAYAVAEALAPCGGTAQKRISCEHALRTPEVLRGTVLEPWDLDGVSALCRPRPAGDEQ